MIGGAVITQEYADEIGADAYSTEAERRTPCRAPTVANRPVDDCSATTEVERRCARYGR